MSSWPATCQLVHLERTLQLATASSLADNPVWSSQTLSKHPLLYVVTAAALFAGAQGRGYGNGHTFRTNNTIRAWSRFNSTSPLR